MVDIVDQCGRFRKCAFTRSAELHMHNSAKTSVHNKRAEYAQHHFEERYRSAVTHLFFSDNADKLHQLR